ncbi:MAG: hypothetical protein PVH45_04655, partial [Candidatus Omnitrophota bacterium]
YAAVEKLYAERLLENALGFQSGLITEEEYIRNIRDIKEYREIYRDTLDKYLLGDIDEVDISDLYAEAGIVAQDAERMHGILADAVPYMTSDEKREFIRGREMTEMLQKFDSVFEAIADRYEGAVFHNMHMGADWDIEAYIHSEHDNAIDALHNNFGSAAEGYAEAYRASVSAAMADYMAKVQSAAGKLAGVSSRRKTFFEKESWVNVADDDYLDFGKAVTPDADGYNNAAVVLGREIIKKLNWDKNNDGVNESVMARLGDGLHRMIIFYNMQMVNPNVGFLYTTMWVQQRLDELFYESSNAMSRIQMLLTNFTSTEGLNFETAQGDRWKAWFMSSGPEAHLANYAYSHDDHLRDAEVGRRVIESLTNESLMPEDLGLELEAQRVLSRILGVDFGEYQYLERSSDARDPEYPSSVAGEDRYHEKDAQGNYLYEGSLAKKEKEVNDKEFLMGAGESNFGTAAFRSSLESAINNDGLSGSLAAAYNSAVDTAISSFSGTIAGNSVAVIGSMNIAKKDGSQLNVVSFRDNDEAIVVWDHEDIDYSAFDIRAKLSGQGDNAYSGYTLENFNTAVHEANNAYVKGLMDQIFILKEVGETVNGAIDWDTAEGLRAAIQPADTYANEGNIGALHKDVFSLVKTQKDFFEDAVGDARDSFEYGSPGTTWDDVTKGLAFGRQYAHLYGKSRFTEFLKPDFTRFTNDATYNALDRTGSSYIKAIGMVDPDNQGYTRNIAWDSWSMYNKGDEFASQIADSLTGGITQFLRDAEGRLIKTKVFGEGEITYETGVIMQTSSGDFVYSRDQYGNAQTDRRETIRSRHVKRQFDLSRIRPLVITSWSDVGVRTVTFLIQFIEDAFAQGLVKFGGIFSHDEFKGLRIDRVFHRGGETSQNIADFAMRGVLQNAEVRGIAGRLGIDLASGGAISAVSRGVDLALEVVRAAKGALGVGDIRMDDNLLVGLMKDLLADRGLLLGRLRAILDVTGQAFITAILGETRVRFREGDKEVAVTGMEAPSEAPVTPGAAPTTAEVSVAETAGGGREVRVTTAAGERVVTAERIQELLRGRIDAAVITKFLGSEALTIDEARALMTALREALGVDTVKLWTQVQQVVQEGETTRTVSVEVLVVAAEGAPVIIEQVKIEGAEITLADERGRVGVRLDRPEENREVINEINNVATRVREGLDRMENLDLSREENVTRLVQGLAEIAGEIGVGAPGVGIGVAGISFGVGLAGDSFDAE